MYVHIERDYVLYLSLSHFWVLASFVALIQSQ